MSFATQTVFRYAKKLVAQDKVFKNENTASYFFVGRRRNADFSLDDKQIACYSISVTACAGLLNLCLFPVLLERKERQCLE